MRVFTQRLSNYTATGQEQTLALPFDTRQKCRFRATLDTGEDIGVDLPRTGVLRSGQFIATNNDEVLKITASPQQLTQVQAANTFELMKAAYHLGNRHVVLMLTPNALYFEPDHVLADMLLNMGMQVSQAMHPFEPESGAYAHHHETRLSPIGLKL